MGGLVSAELAERGAGRIDGAVNTCGLLAGGVDLNNLGRPGADRRRSLRRCSELDTDLRRGYKNVIDYVRQGRAVLARRRNAIDNDWAHAPRNGLQLTQSIAHQMVKTERRTCV
jgi:hypothetical protein